MRFLINVTYDGADFYGWQRQRGKRTAASTLEAAIKTVLNTTVSLKGASRTDRGVHAISQAAHFDVPTIGIPPENLPAALNMHLPPDIKVLSCRLVTDTFHARKSSKGKTYIYKILVSEVALPLYRQTHCIIRPPLSIEKARECLSYVVGTHNFTSFCYADKEGDEGKVRTITAASLTTVGNEIIVEISGNGFLHNMIRILVGTIIRLAKNSKATAADIKTILEAKNRQKAASTAPAAGLYLKEVIY